MSEPYRENKMHTQMFKMAKPIWPALREKEMNLTCAFTGNIDYVENASCHLLITASCLYRLFINGNWIGCGPARAAHGYFRIDEWDISNTINAEKNVFYIEVAGYNINSFYTLDQASFLQAECVWNNEVILYTGKEDGFICNIINEREQRVQRYSFQRPFVEVWNMDSHYYKRYLQKSIKGELLVIQSGEYHYLPRGTLYPEYRLLPALSIIDRGNARVGETSKQYHEDRSLTDIGENLKGFKKNSLTVILSELIQQLDFQSIQNKTDDYTKDTVIHLQPNQYITFAFECNSSGFLSFDVICNEPVTLYLLFDEILTDGVVSFLRADECVNAVRYSLQPGIYPIQTFECYAMKYCTVAVLEGDCMLRDMRIREYAATVSQNRQCPIEHTDIQLIYDAAVNSFRSNAVDGLIDDPSRERAAWLQDSFWTARAENILTGKCLAEQNFLENYRLGTFTRIPKGMIPGCYPSDPFDDDFYVPTNALWLIIQLNEYFKRSGDWTMIDGFRSKIYELLQFFEPFRNEYGLLEGLTGWVFLEWSRAAELQNDVNYPVNMLYSTVLKIAGGFYQDKTLIENAEKLRKVILEQSRQELFFTDNAVRINGRLTPTGKYSEFCQYTAFFFDFATEANDSTLLNILMKDFGSHRDIAQVYPHVFESDVLFGYPLRFEMLYRAGFYTKLLEDILGYYTEMARNNGALWEHKKPTNSLNQAANAHIVYFIHQICDSNLTIS